MSEVGQTGLARAGFRSASLELASTLRTGRNNGVAADALLAAYGNALADFITLMLGPGDRSQRVLTDTTIAATSLIGRLHDDEMLGAWLFALARYECRRYPPVVWGERQWEEMRSLAAAGRIGTGGALPVEVVRMALLGWLAPREREVLVLASTRCKLLSSDLAAIFEVSPEDVVRSVSQAQEKFEQALALCTKETNYQPDPRSRRPEIGELIGMVLSGINRPLPSNQVLHASTAPELDSYRRAVESRVRLNEVNGFPEQPGSASQSTRRVPFEPAVPRPDTDLRVAHRPQALDHHQLARAELSRPVSVVPG